MTAPSSSPPIDCNRLLSLLRVPVLPAAFLFDLDGTLVDSNTYHVQTWAAIAERHHLPLADPEHIGKCGLPTLDVITTLLRWPVTPAEAVALGEEKEALYRDWIRTRGIAQIPGAVEFIRRAHASGIKIAVATSAPRENLDACLDALQLRPYLAATVSSADVPPGRGKPHPDIFLLAADRTHPPPSRCYAFEDAPAGVAAALAAHMPVLALLTSHPAADLAAATAILPSFRPLL